MTPHPAPALPLAAVAFVCMLALTGLSTHALRTTPLDSYDLWDGRMQTSYEAGFEAAMPLNDLAVTSIAALKYAVFGQAQTGAVVGKDGWLFTAEEFTTTPALGANLGRAADEIARVHGVLAQRGVHLIPVIVPDKAEVHRAHLHRPPPAQITLRRPALMALLEARGITALDAFDVLGAPALAQTAFLKDDTHWSPHGARAVARQIAAHHATLDIALPTAAVTTQQSAPVDFDGDLLNFVPTGALRAAFGPAQHQIDVFTTTVQSAAGLLGAQSAAVALVGTSFSAKPQWNFCGFLQDALRAEVVNFATQGQGPFAPMHAYLASAAFRDTPPATVVWEIPARYTSKDMTR